MVTDDDELATIARHGQDRRYHHIRIGMNSRLDTLQAAILLPKLAILDDELAARQAVADRYARKFAAARFTSTPSLQEHGTGAWAQYTVRVPHRERVIELIRGRGVPTAVHYPLSLNRQPAFADSADLPIGDRAAEEVLSLPMHPYL